MQSIVSRIGIPELTRIAGGRRGIEQTDNIGQIAQNLHLVELAEINTPLRLQHFLAQLAHESDCFATTAEYASGAAYEGRKDLGNTQAGDGRRYKGHGLIQVTGRLNHRSCTAWLRSAGMECPDFEAEPKMLEHFPWALLSAVWYWSTRRLNVLADRDDLVGITKAINGGTNGLADRRAKYAIAKSIITPLAAKAVAAGSGRPVLYRGMDNDDVAFVQRELAELGFYALSIDGEFAAGTEGAVRLFQKSKGLKPDGIVGQKTWLALGG